MFSAAALLSPDPNGIYLPYDLLPERPRIQAVSRHSGCIYSILGTHQTQAHMVWGATLSEKPKYAPPYDAVLYVPLLPMDLLVDLRDDITTGVLLRRAWTVLAGSPPGLTPDVIWTSTFFLRLGDKTYDTGVSVGDVFPPTAESLRKMLLDGPPSAEEERLAQRRYLKRIFERILR